MYKLILYGAGKLGVSTYRLLKRTGLERLVYAFCDKNYQDIKEIDGVKVYPYEKLKDSKGIFIVCMKDNAEVVYSQLITDNQKCYINMQQWILEDEKEELEEYLPIIDRLKGTVLVRNYLKKIKKMESILPDSEVIRLGSVYGGWIIPRKFDVRDEYILCAGVSDGELQSGATAN